MSSRVHFLSSGSSHLQLFRCTCTRMRKRRLNKIFHGEYFIFYFFLHNNRYSTSNTSTDTATNDNHNNDSKDNGDDGITSRWLSKRFVVAFLSSFFLSKFTQIIIAHTPTHSTRTNAKLQIKQWLVIDWIEKCEFQINNVVRSVDGRSTR